MITRRDTMRWIDWALLTAVLVSIMAITLHECASSANAAVANVSRSITLDVDTQKVVNVQHVGFSPLVMTVTVQQAGTAYDLSGSVVQTALKWSPFESSHVALVTNTLINTGTGGVSVASFSAAQLGTNGWLYGDVYASASGVGVFPLGHFRLNLRRPVLTGDEDTYTAPDEAAYYDSDELIAAQGSVTKIDFRDNVAASLTGTTLYIDSAGGTNAAGVWKESGTSRGSVSIVDMRSGFDVAVTDDTATVTLDLSEITHEGINFGSDAWGDVIFRGETGYERLAAGTAGYVLTTHGAGVDPTWAASGGGGGGAGDMLQSVYDTDADGVVDEAESVSANSVALGTDTTGGYAASATEGGTATSAASVDDGTFGEITVASDAWALTGPVAADLTISNATPSLTFVDTTADEADWSFDVNTGNMLWRKDSSTKLSLTYSTFTAYSDAGYDCWYVLIAPTSYDAGLALRSGSSADWMLRYDVSETRFALQNYYNSAYNDAMLVDDGADGAVTFLRPVTITDDALTIAEGALADSVIVSADIKDGTIVNADIASDAAIDGVKISPTFVTDLVVSNASPMVTLTVAGSSDYSGRVEYGGGTAETSWMYVGTGSETVGPGSMTVGFSSDNDGQDSLVVGHALSTAATNSVLVGCGSTVAIDGGIRMIGLGFGLNTGASATEDTVNIGVNNSLNASDSMVIGVQQTNTTANSVMIGVSGVRSMKGMSDGWYVPVERDIYYVGPDGVGSDDEDGLSQGSCWATLTNAVATATTAGDVIVALPGTHTLAPTNTLKAALTLANGVTLMGYGMDATILDFPYDDGEATKLDCIEYQSSNTIANLTISMSGTDAKRAIINKNGTTGLTNLIIDSVKVTGDEGWDDLIVDEVDGVRVNNFIGESGWDGIIIGDSSNIVISSTSIIHTNTPNGGAGVNMLRIFDVDDLIVRDSTFLVRSSTDHTSVYGGRVSSGSSNGSNIRFVGCTFSAETTDANDQAYGWITEGTASGTYEFTGCTFTSAATGGVHTNLVDGSSATTIAAGCRYSSSSGTITPGMPGDQLVAQSVANAALADDAVGADELASDAVVKASLAAGDFGDFTAAADGTCTLDADVVAAAEMADADHGDVAWSGGVANVQSLHLATQTLAYSDGTNLAWNAASGPIAYATLTNTAHIAAISNAVKGGTYLIHLTQDGTGGRAVTWDSAFLWPGGLAPTITTNATAVDTISITAFETNVFHSVWQGDFQ